MSLQLIAIIEHLFILLLHIFFLLIKFGLLFFILLHFFGRWAVIFYRYFSFSIFNECIYCNYWVLIPSFISSIVGLASKGCEKLFSFLQLGKFGFYWILIIRWQSHETSHFLATIKIFEVFTLFCKTINVVPTVVWPVHFSSSWFVFLFPSTWYTLEWDRWLLIDQIRCPRR